MQYVNVIFVASARYKKVVKSLRFPMLGSSFEPVEASDGDVWWGQSCNSRVVHVTMEPVTIYACSRAWTTHVTLVRLQR